MSMTSPTRSFHAVYSLAQKRGSNTGKNPAPHQATALTKLQQWFETPVKGPRGGILVLPTGGGKTFTATHFACRTTLSTGFKVLWLAHTHHLLEQAFASFGHNADKIAEPKHQLGVRVVSGTVDHFPVHAIKSDDDVLIASLQTIAKASRLSHPALDSFLDAAGKRLFVIFDEAHHAPAPSYRNLVIWLRERCPELYLLGLTATPIYNDESKSGWLKKIFPQNILSQTSATTLMSQGILAQPIIEEARTKFTPEFTDRDYQTWIATHQDLPEAIISALASSKDRNDHIVAWYAKNRKKYGKTLIFVDRWYQCEYLREALLKQNIRADAIYSHVEASPGSVEARNSRTAAENTLVLQRFRDGDLDVLINVRMLAEGTDVPDVQTVFLTRQTTSSILLTQMVGRALRGPKFGGTADAYIVSFLDDWKHRINWATYAPLAEGSADERDRESESRPPLQLVSIELVRRLARQMDSQANLNQASFTSFLPSGWYVVKFTARCGETDDLDQVRQMLLVFEDDRCKFANFIEAAQREDLSAFESEALRLDQDTVPLLRRLRGQWFPEQADRIGGSRLEEDLFALLRHLAQNDNRSPEFFHFNARNQHDLDAYALQVLDAGLTRYQEDDALRSEYQRTDRYWSVLYADFVMFRSHYDGCVSRILDMQRNGNKGLQPPHVISGDFLPAAEVDQSIKDQVRSRDGHRCLCCGLDRRSRLQVDHIKPYYFGGSHDPDNLQTLCASCNGEKGIKQMDFRINTTTLTTPAELFPDIYFFHRIQATDKSPMELHIRRSINLFYQCAAVREVVALAWGDKQHHWRVSLYPGNDPRWLEPHKDCLVQKIQEARRAAGHQPAPLEMTFVS